MFFLIDTRILGRVCTRVDDAIDISRPRGIVKQHGMMPGDRPDVAVEPQRCLPYRCSIMKPSIPLA